ncbi:MAG: YraN family protein [candidate division Zixibacteria bacterium]|nr:YraN family protein [candidate division Zixibacteria bacterium]
MPSNQSDGGSTPRKKKFALYEEKAADYFREQGFVIVERNWRSGHKEIDLIVQKESLLVFAEVKSSNGEKFGHPSERVDNRKQKHLTLAAQAFILSRQIEKVDLRFDVITFMNGKLEHYPNAFPASE